ncbi:MAG: ferredoxin [Candidatus Micrarchaeota archaeon]
MVVVDRNKCIGCGACVAICGDVFEIFEGKSRVKKKAPADEPCIDQAVSSCPMGAIEK